MRGTLKAGSKDVQDIKGAIDHTGEFRVHLLWAKSGMHGCTARMWHPDGWRVGHAGGCGYDKGGAALGEAINLFFGEELKARKVSALYGARKLADRRVVVDGSCGMESMLEILRARGFRHAEAYDTGKLSTMVLCTGRKPVK